jgi:4-amino-4-deoxy-L-arabinose transferase-like glycosyltransferase
MNKKKLIDSIILVFFLIVYGFNLYSLSLLDVDLPPWDEAVHLRDSIVIYNIWKNPSQINITVIKDLINKSEKYPLIRPSGYFPPFAPLITSFFHLIFGTSSQVAIMSNMFFISVLILSLYSLGTTLCCRFVGLLASFFILLFPIVFQHSFIYMLDMPLTAMVAFGTYILIKSNFFQNTKFSILAGVAFGLGMLTKWSYLFFMIGPLSYVIYKSFYAEASSGNKIIEPMKQKKIIYHIFLFSLTAVLTFGPYYIPIIFKLIYMTLKNSSSIFAEGPETLYSFASISFYPVVLWNKMITPLGGILFAFGLLFLSFSKIKSKKFLLIWILVPYGILTFFLQNKCSRHMMPWLLPISIIMAYGINRLESINIGGKNLEIKKYSTIIFISLFVILFYNKNITTRKEMEKNDEEKWHIKEIVSILAEDMKKGTPGDLNRSEPLYVGVIPDHYRINAQTLRYYTTLEQLPINIIKLQNYDETDVHEFISKFDRYDYILTKSPPNITKSEYQKSVDDMNSFFNSHTKCFQNLTTFHEPDGSFLKLSKKFCK